MQLHNILFLALFSVVFATSNRKECTVPAGGTNATDDAPAIREAFHNCGSNGRVIFKHDTYYINSPLNITGLKNVNVDIHGTLEVGLF